MMCMAGIAVCAEPADSAKSFSVQVVNELARHCVTGYIGQVWTNHFIALSGHAKVFAPSSMLNSNGPNIAPVVNTNLAEHFNVELPFPGTWRVYYLGYSASLAEKGFNCFYTPQDIRGESVGTVIDWVLKYNTESGTYYTGSSKVAKDSATYVEVISGTLSNLTEFDPSTLPSVAPSPEGEAKSSSATLNFGKPFSLIVFGDFTCPGGDIRESALVWGNAAITNMSIASAYKDDVCLSRDALLVGGDFHDALKSIGGNIVFGGDRIATQAWYSVDGYQQLHQFPVALNEYGNASATGAVTEAVMRKCVEAVSTNLAAMAVNGTGEQNGYMLTLTGTDATANVFSVSAEDWRQSVFINVPTNSRVVVNIMGEMVTNRLVGISINGDSNGHGTLGAVTNVVFNFVDAKTIEIGANGGGAPNFNGFFLAPHADVVWHGGNAYGPVIVGGNLTCGNLQFECQGYNGFDYGDVSAGNEPTNSADHAPVKDSGADTMVYRPDFAITAMDWIVKPSLTGEVMVASITVANRGEKAADSGSLSIYRSAAGIAATGTEGDMTLRLGVIEPNTSTNVVVTLTAAPDQGTHHLRAFIDSWDEVLEWSNGDNQLELAYAVDPITLSVQILADSVQISWNNFWGQKYQILGSPDIRDPTSWKVISGFEEIDSARSEQAGSETNTVIIPFSQADGCSIFRLRVLQR